MNIQRRRLFIHFHYILRLIARVAQTKSDRVRNRQSRPSQIIAQDDLHAWDGLIATFEKLGILPHKGGAKQRHRVICPVKHEVGYLVAEFS